MSNPEVGDVYEWVAPMAPFPKARPRVTRNGTFMPAKYQRQRDELALYCGDVPDFSSYQIRLQIDNVRPMPKSWSDKKKVAMDGQWCSAGADADNAAGAVMDALFDEDSCVVDLVSRKVWGYEAQIGITITVLTNDPVPF
jgi:Holliday junction resolvase RusA-like endonuclease